MDLTKQFFKYVSQNIFGLLGTSCYILADTYFIAQAAGTDGVTLLNLCLPIYNFIFAIGSMIALGSATRYAIAKAQNDARGQRYFSNAILCACLIAIPFMLAGAFCPGTLLQLMGGDGDIVALGLNYTRIFLLFTPFFMCNYIFSAFVRNDGDPSLAMVATLSGSLFNVVFDYIFIFPMGLGLPGAALATAISPVLSIAICSRHFFQKSNTLTFVRQAPSARLLVQSCQLGISGFVGELSSAVTTTVFNFLLLRLAGNVGVAAYGVVANFALVATAIFNGVAQGAQPLISQCYGKNEIAGAKKLLLLGCGTALALAAVCGFGWYGYTACDRVSFFDARLQAYYQQAENGANGWVLETRAEDVYLKPTHADWHYEAIRYRIPWVHDALDKVLKKDTDLLRSTGWMRTDHSAVVDAADMTVAFNGQDGTWYAVGSEPAAWDEVEWPE